MAFKYQDFIPKSIICFREGYNKQYFFNDVFAGISVGVIAMPLALAFAIGSGVTPERGLFTAIVAGFLISLLGGSRVQIGGPTGAFVVIVYTIIQKYGYNGLAVATLIAGVMMILMGLARFGVLLKFIPFPVTVGFTTGIAVVIFSSQLKDFFGLQIENVPPKFIEKCSTLCQFAHTWNIWAFLIAFSTLALIFMLRRLYPKLPGVIIAVALATILMQFFQLPLTTIESKFGGIPNLLPTPAFPSFSYDLIKTVFPDAITIALLGAIESLLSAVVADGMIGHKHRSNCELVAQGFANIGSIFFGGIPATGAIARTTANIRLGAKTPVAGMIHAMTLLFLMVFLAPLASKIPLAALSAVLVFVAWNMSELPHFFEILKGPKGDATVLLITFLLTVLIDLTVAVQIGVILSAFIFIKHMADRTTVEACKILVEENSNEKKEPDDDLIFEIEVPLDVRVFEIRGPFFYSVADLLDEAFTHLEKPPRVFILRLNKTSLIDATGIQAIKQFSRKCKLKSIIFLLSDVSEEQMKLLQDTGIEKLVGEEKTFKDIDSALIFAK
jgi:SulP family sulfate permease